MSSNARKKAIARLRELQKRRRVAFRDELRSMRLTPRERDVLAARFGYGDESIETDGVEVLEQRLLGRR